MSKLRVANFTISLDGFGAGPHQDIGNPLGYACTRHVATPLATHVILARQ